jgi:hypothetical protein
MLTPPEIGRRLRVSADKVRGWIMRGELRAIDVADRVGSRPRWRVAPNDLADFEARRTATRTPPVKRRRQRTGVIEYY